MQDFPSAPWTDAFAKAINENDVYRKHGEGWTFGAVTMICEADATLGLPERVAMTLDVERGACRGAKYQTGQGAGEDAPFVILAPYARWKQVIRGEIDPIKAMMEGKLKMTKGSLPTMLRFVESSRALVVSATKVPTRFRDENPERT